ncbi:hypothetical protein [Corallococcus sp. CA054B]|uniref:hypothetical protein n=1 Tax=Corallococcus sp. CA054B TaxID=2316734 RepID=UPI0013151F20|nr:hypothetical protein [Corallococcus sp. CA054B]
MAFAESAAGGSVAGSAVGVVAGAAGSVDGARAASRLCPSSSASTVSAEGARVG